MRSLDKRKLKVNGRTKSLGSYATIEEAAHARKEAEKMYYGSIDTLNYKEGV